MRLPRESDGMPQKQRESDLKRTIVSYLETCRLFWWPQNTGTVIFTDKRDKKRLVKFGKKGSPDIFVLKSGTLYGLELKAPDGEQSEDQKEFELRCRQNGGIYLLVRRLEDVTRVL